MALSVSAAACSASSSQRVAGPPARQAGRLGQAFAACRPPPGWSCPGPSAAPAGPCASASPLPPALRRCWRTKSATRLVQLAARPGDGVSRSVLRPAARELQADRAAAVADHHLAQQAVQLVDVARRQLVAAVDEVLLELPGRAQQARLQQRDQVEQLLEVVLHRRGGQQQDVLLLQLAGELPELGVAVAQVVGLIDDDQVPVAGQDGGAVRLALGGVHRGDDAGRTRSRRRRPRARKAGRRG